MSRLAAIEKLLYYPTPPEEIDEYMRLAFGDMLKYNGPRMSQINLTDPCSGEGRALLTASMHITGMRKVHHLVELDVARAEQAREKFAQYNELAEIYNGDFAGAQITGTFEFIFLNPPYDTVDSQRLEIKWLRMVGPHLTPGKGFLMLVVPESVVDRRLEVVCDALDLKPAYHSLRFSEKNYAAFKQVILLLSKNMYEGTKYSLTPLPGHMKDPANLHHGRRGNWTQLEGVQIQPTIQLFDGKLDDSILEGELPSSLIEVFGNPNQRHETKVIMDLREELAATLVAAGLFTGMKIDDDKVIRGQIIQETEVKEYKSPEGTNVREEIPKQIAILNVLNLNTGEISRISSESDAEKFNSIIVDNAAKFSKAVRELYPPVLTPEYVERWRPELNKVRSPRLIAGYADALMEPQLVRAAAVLRQWDETTAAVIAGEPGVGKTVTSIAAAVQIANRKGNPKKRKVVVLLPAKDDLVDKWEEEIKTSLREYKPRVFTVNSISDARKAFEYPGLAFILLKETMIKRSSGWNNLSFKTRRGDRKIPCPTCGRRVFPETREGKELLKWEVEKARCPACRSGLWTAVRDRNHNAFSPISAYIRDRYKEYYTLIVDEAHGYKGGDSARAYASNDLIVSAHKVLLMTGTLYNGMASSIFYLLYRSQPEFREVFKYNDASLFVGQYGLQKKIEKRSRGGDTTYSWSGYSKVNRSVQEIPGIHPLMLLWLIGNTIYFKLDDMDLELPPKHEYTLFVDPLPEVKKEVTNFLGDLRRDGVALSMAKPPDMTILGKWVHARTGTWDAAPIGDWPAPGYSLPPVLPDQIHTKEEALLRIILKHAARGERTLIYYEQINVRPIQDRLMELASDYGISLVYMPSSTKKRTPFVKQAIRNGANAIITNPHLVKEGIDLIMFKAIVWYGTTYDANLAQQANRRIYRIGQTSETSMYFLGYNETEQAVAFTVLAQKMQAAQVAHGDLRSGIAAILGQDNLITTVQDGLIDVPHYDSDLTMDSLPPLVPLVREERPIGAIQVELAKELGQERVQLSLF